MLIFDEVCRARNALFNPAHDASGALSELWHDNLTTDYLSFAGDTQGAF
jgi:hypothetical protein